MGRQKWFINLNPLNPILDFWLHHIVHCTAEKVGQGEMGMQDHPQGAVHMAATRLGHKSGTGWTLAIFNQNLLSTCRGLRVLYRGGRGALEFLLPPSHNFPPPEILKLSMVIIVLSQVLNKNLVPDCVRSNLRGGSCYYHRATILFPPQLKILHETLGLTSGRVGCLGSE